MISMTGMKENSDKYQDEVKAYRKEISKYQKDIIKYKESNEMYIKVLEYFIY